MIAGVFPDRPQAERAVRTLQQRGVSGEQIAIVSHDHRPESAVDRIIDSLAAEGAVIGLVAGGLVGSLVGALTSPAAALAGTTGGALAGAVLGGLIGVRRPREEARHFETGYKTGQVLVTVDDSTEETRTILKRYGADLRHGVASIEQREASPAPAER